MAVELFLRLDQGLFSITEGILSAILRNELIVDYNASWRNREFLIDYLINNTSLTKILRHYDPYSSTTATTTIIQKKQYTRLVAASRQFLKKIDAPNHRSSNLRQRHFSLIFGNQQLRNLTWKERRVLMLLNHNKGIPVSDDDIGEIIFRNEERFSLYAVSKFIQRLREKLEENDLPGNLIETVRGQGYVLK